MEEVRVEQTDGGKKRVKMKTSSHKNGRENLVSLRYEFVYPNEGGGNTTWSCDLVLITTDSYKHSLNTDPNVDPNNYGRMWIYSKLNLIIQQIHTTRK